MNKKALLYLNILLLLDIYLGVKIFASFNFAYILLASWGATYILARRLPLKTALLVPGVATTVTYFLFFDPTDIPWKANLIIISTFLQLQAWASIYRCKDLSELSEFERKIINCLFIGILMPMYLALSGYTLRYTSYANDKLSLLLYTLLALLFLEATRHKPKTVTNSAQNSKWGKMISLLALLLLMATSLLTAHVGTGYFYNFIPSAARYIKRHDPQFTKAESKRITQDQNHENQQSVVGYSNEAKLNSSFSLNKDFSIIDLSLKIHEGQEFIQSERIYLRCNQYFEYRNNEWFGNKNNYQESISDNQGWTKIKDSKTNSNIHYSITRFNKNLTKLPLIGEALKVKAYSAKINSRVIEVPIDPKAEENIEVLSEIPDNYDIKLNPSAASFYMPKTKIEKKIAQLAKTITEKSPTIEDKIYELRNYLHRYCQYSLIVENSYNMNPLENFLFHERKGHCVLFASAYCLMLKSIGVEATLCSGYYGGDFQKESGDFLFYPGNAHTWVEIKLNNDAYKIIDPTPGVINWIARGVRQKNEVKSATLLSFLKNIYIWWSQSSLQKIYIIIALFSLIPFIILWKWKLWKSLLPSKSCEPKYLITLLNSMNKIKERHPSQSLREYYSEIISIKPSVNELHEVIDYTYKVKFHDKPRNPDLEKSFLKKVRLFKF